MIQDKNYSGKYKIIFYKRLYGQTDGHDKNTSELSFENAGIIN